MDVETAFDTLPVPSVARYTPSVPVALAFRVILPLEPDCVWNSSERAEKGLDPVILPLAVKFKSPLVDVTAPVVVMWADEPVVVRLRVCPVVDVPKATAPTLVMSAVEATPVELTVMLDAAV
jgi:hypothetical protein